MVDYVFKPYNPQLPKIFEQEKRRLRQFLFGEYKIEHFGSTAIPGLGGKGIIDIYLIVPKKNLETVFKGLESAGYEFRPNAGNAERFVFVREIRNKDQEKERYHLHVTYTENSQWKIDLAFRDYLRTHPKDLEEYADIKQKAAAEANQSKEEYMRIKKPVIERILAKTNVS
jgi:GrpB-like predicted nucleotidyltransferase (UPF0157 family)